MAESAGLLTSIINRAGWASAFGAKFSLAHFIRTGEQESYSDDWETDNVSFVLFHPSVATHHNVHLNQTH